MRFKEYLFEAQASKEAVKYTELELSTAINMLNDKCKDALWMLENNRPIFRADREFEAINDFYIVDPTKTTRKSQSLGNYYTVILDNHPDMKDWPSRSKSFIATFSRNYAGNFGIDPFVLIPFDGVKIGCVNKHDIWGLELLICGFEQSPADFAMCLKKMGVVDTWEGIDDFQSLLDENDQDAVAALLKQYPKAEPKQFLENIISAFAPKKTEMSMCTTRNMPHTQDGEVWVNGKCVLIKYDMWKKLVTAFKDSK